MTNPLKNPDEDVQAPPNAKVVSVTLRADGKMEVIKRVASNATYMGVTQKPVPDAVYKEIYGAGPGGLITLERTIKGSHTPAYQVPEKIEFPADISMRDLRAAAEL